jgi:hypothetical protein
VFVTGDEIDREMQEIAENLHRSDLTALERDMQISRWVELQAAKEVSDNLSETPNKGGRPGKAAATARAIGDSERNVQRAVKVASLSDEAKQTAKEGRPSRFFYWDDEPSRRLRPEQVDSKQALQEAQTLARTMPLSASRSHRRRESEL